MCGVRHQKGVAALLVAMTILFAATLLTFFTARVIVTDNKIHSNMNGKCVAENAALAGFDYAVANLDYNLASVIDGTTLTGTLTNSATYSVVYTYLSGNQKIRITSTGNSSDNTASRVVQAIVMPVMIIKVPNSSVVTQGAMTMTGSSNVTNDKTNPDATKTIELGGAFSITTPATTTLLGVTGPKGVRGADVVTNASLASMATTDFEATYLGMSVTDYFSYASITNTYSVNTTFDKNTNTQYQTGGASDMTGHVAYFNLNGHTLFLGNGFTAGSATVPATIVVDGNVSINNSGNFIGNIFATKTVTIKNNSGTFDAFLYGSTVTLGNKGIVNGGVIAGADGVIMSNNSQIIINNATAAVGYSQYGMVPGSWKDF